MEPRRIGFVVTTGLVAVPNLLAGFAYLAGAMDDAMTHLGYPLYFATILGAWKVLGAIALLSPSFAPWVPRVKEWAYAGFFFLLTGATISHLAVGDAAGEVAAPAILAGLLVASYALRPAPSDG